MFLKCVQYQFLHMGPVILTQGNNPYYYLIINQYYYILKQENTTQRRHTQKEKNLISSTININQLHISKTLCTNYNIVYYLSPYKEKANSNSLIKMGKITICIISLYMSFSSFPNLNYSTRYRYYYHLFHLGPLRFPRFPYRPLRK